MTNDRKKQAGKARSSPQEIDEQHRTPEDVEDELDEGLRDTFPASDPVAISQPTTATPSKSDHPLAESGDEAREAADRNRHRRVNVSETEEILYWTRKFGVSEEELKHAVRTVGFFPRDVADFLGKSL